MVDFRNDARIVEGMKAQLLSRRQAVSDGAKPIGWKVGFGARAMLDRLQLDKPLVGFLTDRGLVRSGETVSLAGWVKPVAEPEIAVHIGNDLLPGGGEASVRAAIKAIGPAIELADLDPPPDDVAKALAGNIYQRRVIVGPADASRAGGKLDGLRLVVRRNGAEVANTTDLEASTGKILAIVGHVAEVLSHFGERLRAGEFVICGSVVPAFFLESGDTEFVYELEPVGSISVRFTAG